MRTHTLPTLLGLLATSCVTGADSAPGRKESTVTNRGTHLNSTNTRGTHLNGTHATGTTLISVAYGGMTLDGVSLSSVRLDGSMLAGYWHGRFLEGTELAGAGMVGSASDGTTVALRIDGVTQEAAPDDDIWLYDVSYEDVGGWSSICGADENGDPIQAIAVAGRWDTDSGYRGAGGKIADATQFTLACQGVGAVAKCVDMGYKPWLGLDYHHQACVRMIRDDLCGTSHPFTTDGREIDVWDAYGIQTREASGFTFEAEWTPFGARCISVDLRDRMLASGSLPLCILNLVSLTCGSSYHFATGTLTMDSVRSDQLYLPPLPDLP